VPPHQLRYADTGCKPSPYGIRLISVQRCGASEHSTFRLSPLQAGLRAFNQEITLELGHGFNDTRRHLSGPAGQIDAAQSEAMNPHGRRLQTVHCGGNIDCIPAQTVELGDDQRVILFQLVHQPHEARTLLDGGTARHGFRHRAARRDREARGLDLLNLVFGGLASGGDVDLGECASHW